MSRRTWRTLGGAAGLATLLVVAWGPAGPAWADGQAPAGNNGTVKINDKATPDQDNDPHVGCSFSVSFYGYDAGDRKAGLTFQGQAPTRGSGSVTLSTSWSTGSRTGGDQLDQTVPVSFSQLAGLFKGVAPAHQGYHVKLTVHVTGSQGSDVKHKVFWIDCAPAPAGKSGGSAQPGTPGTPGTPAAVAASQVAPPTASRAPLTAVEGLTLAAPAAATGAATPAGATTPAGAATTARTAAPAPTGAPAALPAARTGAAVAGSTLAFTGFRVLGIAGLGGGLLAGGTALAVLGRRRRGRV